MPTRAENEYLRSLYSARNASLGVNVEAQRRIKAMLSRGLDRLSIDLANEHITRAQALNLRKQMEGLLEAFAQNFDKSIAAGQDVTIQKVQAIHDQTIAKLAKERGLRLTAPFDNLDEYVYRNLAMRRGAASFKSLSAYALRDSLLPEIDAFLGQAVTRGVAQGRAALDLAKIIAADDPVVTEALARLPSGMRALSRGGLKSVDWSRYGIAPQNMKQTRMLLYNARRIAVSELHNTYREATAGALVVSPVVAGATWQLGGRHMDVDECDVLAQSDLYGHGPGVYPPEKWPAGPHPHCACYAGSVKQRPVSEWTSPKPPAPTLRVNPDAEDLYTTLAEKGGWTANRLARAKATVKQTVDLAEEAHATSTKTLKPKPVRPKPPPKPKPVKPPEPKPAPAPAPAPAPGPARQTFKERYAPIQTELDRQVAATSRGYGEDVHEELHRVTSNLNHTLQSEYDKNDPAAVRWRERRIKELEHRIAQLQKEAKTAAVKKSRDEIVEMLAAPTRSSFEFEYVKQVALLP